MKYATTFLSGLLFAVGLGVGGMTQPAKVIGFLDITGNWDPALMFVIAGAIGTYSLIYRLSRRRNAPVLATNFQVPTRKDVDRRLLAGAAIFGAGWGLGGFCPGPALTSLASGQTPVLVFVVAMLGGMALFDVAPVAARQLRTVRERLLSGESEDMPDPAQEM